MLFSIPALYSAKTLEPPAFHTRSVEVHNFTPPSIHFHPVVFDDSANAHPLILALLSLNTTFHHYLIVIKNSTAPILLPFSPNSCRLYHSIYCPIPCL